MEESSYSNLPTSYLLGSVPAAISEDKNTTSYEVPGARLQIFPPNSGGDRQHRYQTLETPIERDETSNWKGVFNIASYTQYFDVDTDIVVTRLISSLHPTGGDFFNKIDANPDLYGLVWICTTLVFLLASLGNLATYLSTKGNDWRFDVGYVSFAAWFVYGYGAGVPLAFYFFLKYMGSDASLLRLWCMWGYSFFSLALTSFALVIPVELVRWVIAILSGAASATFVTQNLRSYMAHNELPLVLAISFLLQMTLALFIKVRFFP